MTNKDKRFLEYWEDQRKGTKTEYYATYSIGWTIAIFLGIFFFLKIILDEYSVGSMTTLYFLVPGSVLIALLLTHFTYIRNEKKYHLLKNNQAEGGS